MVKEEKFRFLSKDGRTKVHAVKWTPDSGEYKAIVQISHGMVEFIERYREFAEFLTKNGYLVVGHDHLGHGKSVSNQKDWGYFAAEHPSDVLVADMHKLRTLMMRRNPGVPYVMIGHSMGSYMLRKYLSLHGEGLSGAIILGTGSVPDKTTKLGICVVKILAKFFGWHHRSRLVEHFAFGGDYKQFDLKGRNVKNSWLTKDAEIVESYYHEPKCSFTFTLNGYLGLFEAVLFDNQPENIVRIPKEVPILLASGADDPVGNMGEGVKRVHFQFLEAGIRDVVCKLYENDRHEILNETDRDIVYRDILGWLDVHVFIKSGQPVY